MATLYGISTLWNISLKAKLQGLHVHVQLLGIMHIIDDVIMHDYAQEYPAVFKQHCRSIYLHLLEIVLCF